MKPGNEIRHVSSFSNHPPNIIKQIPKIVQDRISMLSSSEDIFIDNIGPYQKAIEEAGYQEKLKFDKEIHSRTRQNLKTARSRLITWYHSTWNMLVRNFSAKIFLF